VRRFTHRQGRRHYKKGCLDSFFFLPSNGTYRFESGINLSPMRTAVLALMMILLPLRGWMAYYAMEMQ
jgi:hypothetical protein